MPWSGPRRYRARRSASASRAAAARGVGARRARTHSAARCRARWRRDWRSTRSTRGGRPDRSSRRARRRESSGSGLVLHTILEVAIQDLSPCVLAAVMPAPRVPVEIREFPEPPLPPGGALLRTALSEVCGTDVHLWHGRLAGVPYPIIPGHVTTGTLDAIRGSIADVRTAAPLREGDRVAFFDVHRTCGRCPACTVAPHADAGVRRAGCTASPIRPPTASLAAGRRRCTSSPAWSSRGCRMP